MTTALAPTPLARASFVFQEASIELSASSADELIAALERFGIKAKGAAAPKAATPSPSPAPAPAAAKTEPAGNAPASTATPASAPPASAGSEANAGSPHPYNYKDIAARVVEIVKTPSLGTDKAKALLGEFGVDHANKLKLEQFPDFVAKADALLGGVA